MGRITIFTEDDNMDCRRLLEAFEKRDLWLSEINLTEFPFKRSDMLSMTNKFELPQVFLNDTHIGGASDAMRLLRSWDQDPDMTPQEMFLRMVDSAPEPRDLRLQVPKHGEANDDEQLPILSSPVITRTRLSLASPSLLLSPSSHHSNGSQQYQQTSFVQRRRSSSTWIKNTISNPLHFSDDTSKKIIPLPRRTNPTTSSKNRSSLSIVLSPSGKKSPKFASAFQMIKTLQALVKRKDLGYHMTTYKNSFKASSLITALSEHYQISREEAVEFALELQQKYALLDHVVSEHLIEDSDGLYFRLACDQTPHILNSFRTWDLPIVHDMDDKNNTKKYKNSNKKNKMKQQAGDGEEPASTSTAPSEEEEDDDRSSSYSAAGDGGGHQNHNEGSVTSSSATTAASTTDCDMENTFTSHNEDDDATILEDEEHQMEASELMYRLFKLLMKIIKDNTISGWVDYKACKGHPLYDVFEEAVCELQTIQLDKLLPPIRLAFGINLYNLMIQYACIKVGVPGSDSSVKRQQFFASLKIQLANHQLLSLNDIEHGILRNNRKPPNAILQAIASAAAGSGKGGSGSGGDGANNSSVVISNHYFTNRKDKKHLRKLVMPYLDHRIHFAMNCGVQSSPELRYYDSEAIEEELRISSQDYCTSQIQVDEIANELKMPQIFQWYRDDILTSIPSSSTAAAATTGPPHHLPEGFQQSGHRSSLTNNNNLDMAQVVLGYLKGSKKSSLMRMIDLSRNGERPSLKISYFPYDWSPAMARDYVPFNMSNIKPNVSRLSRK